MFRPSLAPRPLVIVVVFALAGTFPATASAGLLVVKDVEPNTKVSIEVDYLVGDTPTDYTASVTPTGNTAQFSLLDGSLAEEATITSVFVTKMPVGQMKPITYEIEVSGTGRTLASLEPFDLPTFTSPSTSLVAVVDIGAFLAQGDPFTIGQIVTVTNGSIQQTSAINFKDGSSLGPDTDLTQALIDSLPDYNGEGIVLGFDQVDPIPEPSTLTLLGLGISSLLGYAWRRRKRAVAAAA